MEIPRFIIAGTNSGCGKTTISTGIMAALLKKDLMFNLSKLDLTI
jgi:cobyrinic acid a,c-diamide synthase